MFILWAGLKLAYTSRCYLACSRGIGIGLITEYYTSAEYSATRQVAQSATTGHATVIIQGLAVGMGSIGPPFMLLIVATIIASFYVAGGGAADFNHGLYGVGLAAVGMLSTLALP